MPIFVAAAVLTYILQQRRTYITFQFPDALKHEDQSKNGIRILLRYQTYQNSSIFPPSQLFSSSQVKGVTVPTIWSVRLLYKHSRINKHDVTPLAKSKPNKYKDTIYFHFS